MSKLQIASDLVTIEVRYAFGHLYWDRCGQTLFDIETKLDGWFEASDNKHTGKLEHPEKDRYCNFNNKSFSFSAKKIKDSEIEEFINDANKTYKIVRANLGIEEIERLGYRMQYIIPTKSIDESEDLISKSGFNIKTPDSIIEKGYKTLVRQSLGIYELDGIEYRVEIKGIVRTEGIDPSRLYQGNPRYLSRRQHEYRNLKLQQEAQYSSNPMYAVMLDVDCYVLNPDSFSFNEHFMNNQNVIDKDFKPILENL